MFNKLRNYFDLCYSDFIEDTCTMFFIAFVCILIVSGIASTVVFYDITNTKAIIRKVKLIDYNLEYIQKSEFKHSDCPTYLYVFQDLDHNLKYYCQDTNKFVINH